MIPSSSSTVNGVSKAVAVLLIIFLLTFPSKPDGSLLLRKTRSLGLKDMKVRVGSSPPRCVDKCLSCKPCTATLVTSQQHRNSKDGFGYSARSEEERYYLLSWKCRCGDKLFQP